MNKDPLTKNNRAPASWIIGWCSIIDGICLVISLGFFSPQITLKFVSKLSKYRIAKRLKNRKPRW